MNSMNEEELNELAARLNSIYSNEYQQYCHAIKELSEDIRRCVVPPHISPLKLVVSSEHGEVRFSAEDMHYKALKKVMVKAVELNESIDAGVKENFIKNMHGVERVSRAERIHDSPNILGNYCPALSSLKEKRDAEAEIVKKNKIKSKRVAANILTAGELHITYQKNSGHAVLDELFQKHSIFMGYMPFDELLAQAGISEHPDLKIYLHHEVKKREEIRRLKAYAGSLKKENGVFYLNGTILLDGGIPTVEKWLKACYAYLAGTPRHLRNDPDFPVIDGISELTQKDAEMLAEIVLDHVRNGLPSERKSLELIRETLGDDAVNQLKNESRLVVKSKNGRTYIIREDGEVRESESGRKCCVVVDAKLPKYDQMLAKYLAIRDRPEMIKTLWEIAHDSDSDPHGYYLVMFKKIIHRYGQKIETIGFKTRDFNLNFDASRLVWSITVPAVEVAILGGKGLTLSEVHGEENNLTMELWDWIGAEKLTPEFLNSADYMKAAFEHYLAYLERYLAWTPEYVIMRKERFQDDETEEKIRRIREMMEMRRMQEIERGMAANL